MVDPVTLVPSARPAPTTHPICTDPTETLTVTCYVRDDVSIVSRRQIAAVRRRLEALTETSLLEEKRLRQWPPQKHAVEEESETPRRALIDRFSRWADSRGYSLQPAVRRQSISNSLVATDHSHATINVPIVMLAFRAPTEEQPLRGVVPYTVTSESEEMTVYTVNDWLTAAENTTDVDDAHPP